MAMQKTKKPDNESNANNQRGARELALKGLFEQEFHPQQKSQNPPFPSISQCPQTIHYSIQLLRGVTEAKPQIDALIEQTSASWKITRMPLIDLNIMRIAIYEMRFANPPVPFKVCINEAVEIAKIYGTEDSPAFINGILDPISHQNNHPNANHK